jgi:hypothetical protein
MFTLITSSCENDLMLTPLLGRILKSMLFEGFMFDVNRGSSERNT